MPKPTDENPMVCLRDEMAIFRTEMEAVDRVSKKVGARTGRIIRAVAGILSFAAVVLMVLTYFMARDLGNMIASMDNMYVEFGSMSEELNAITHHVDNMGNAVHGMPAIAADMQHLNGSVGKMSNAMEGMNGNIHAMDNSVGRIGMDTSEMAFRFHNMQRTVGVMGHDVHQLMRPMSILPR